VAGRIICRRFQTQRRIKIMVLSSSTFDEARRRRPNRMHHLSPFAKGWRLYNAIPLHSQLYPAHVRRFLGSRHSSRSGQLDDLGIYSSPVRFPTLIRRRLSLPRARRMSPRTHLGRHFQSERGSDQAWFEYGLTTSTAAIHVRAAAMTRILFELGYGSNGGAALVRHLP